MKRHHLFKDLTGRKFGMLTAVSPSHSDGKTWHWVYSCDCGFICIKTGQDVTKDLKRGGTPNCGCSTKRLIGEGNTRHGMSKHPAYWVWRSMRDRCRLPTHQAWANYGGRGIRVCEDWNSDFMNFWRDMGPTYRSGLEIDRRDNDGNYELGNCRWVTCLSQANNRRGNKRINTPDGLLTVAQAARRFGLTNSTIYERIKRGWPDDLLLDPANANLKLVNRIS